MLIVRVELWTATTGERNEIARMQICNLGTGTPQLGDYEAKSLRGRSAAELDKGVATRACLIGGYPRRRLHVWCLVARALHAMAYTKGGRNA